MGKRAESDEDLLRQAVKRAKANAQGALDDLVRFTSSATETVAKVTGRRAVLELVPINEGEGAGAAYQLQLRKAESEAPPSDLGVYRVTNAGYPVQRWFSRRKWESFPKIPDGEYPGAPQLKSHFKWMISDPDSRLVVLLTFFQKRTERSPEWAAPRAWRRRGPTRIQGPDAARTVPRAF